MEMTVAIVNVSGVVATANRIKLITRGIVGAKVQIVYDSSVWTGLRKTVVFEGSGVTRDVLDAGEIVEIPPEVASEANSRIRMGIYGVSDDGSVVVPTIWAELGRVRYSADPSGDESTAPELPVWAQLDGRVKKLESQAPSGGDSGSVKNAVLYTEQDLTYDQQMQARKNIGVLEPFGSSTADITPAQVSQAMMEGRNVVVVHNDPTYGVIYFNGFVFVPGINVIAASGVQPFDNTVMHFSLIGDVGNGSWTFNYGEIVTPGNIPDYGGNVDLTGVVKSVNGQTPDESGNVEIETNTPSDEQIAAAVNKWLDEHTEATTTVKWGNISAGEIFELATDEEPSVPVLVPCTGITLDKTELSFSDTETTVVLQATVTPFDTTDSIEWSVDNSGVATVENGVVKAIANGSCIVTAKCGAYSATCSVTVKIIASYTKANLAAMYDLTQYEDGYLGEVEDMSGNGNVPVLTGQESYTTGRNGFVGGKFMANPHKTQYSSITIPNAAMSALPFTLELYAHFHDGHNMYAPDGEVGFTNAQGSVSAGNEQLVAGTCISHNGIRMLASYNADTNVKTLCMRGPLNDPVITETVENLQIDNIRDGDITDVYNHIVYCVGATEQKIYCDGILIVSNESGDQTTRLATTNDYKLCAGTLSADFKLIRVYNAVLTDEQVANNYSNTIAVYGGDA